MASLLYGGENATSNLLNSPPILTNYLHLHSKNNGIH